MASRIDWAALLKVDPDLPQRLNRAFFSVDAESRALRTLISDLESSAEVDVSALEAADAALDARVDILEAGVGLEEEDADGGLFSMVGPLSGTDPVVAWDFTQFDPTLTNAQNITAANISGDSAYNLTGNGAPSVASVIPFDAPAAILRGAGGLSCGNTTTYVHVSPAPAGIRLLGDMSVEWCGRFVATFAGTSGHLFGVGGPTEVEADNYCWLFQYNVPATSGTWNYFAESGAGVNIDVNIHANILTPGAPNIGMVHVVFTRVSNIVRLYLNGRQVSAAVNTVTTPTGGSTGNFLLGDHPVGGAHLLTYGFRVFNYGLSAAQVLESYSRTMFARAAPT